MGNDNILIVVVIAVIAYVVMTGKAGIAAVSTAVTAACPRGQKYSRGFFGDCDPNYVFGGWLDQDCVCLTQTPTAIPTAAQSPQTPAPTRGFPYVGTAPAGGIGRCKMYRDGKWWALSGCDADDYNCKSYQPATIADYFLRECRA